MKILVFSDSHGMSNSMKKAAKLHTDTDAVIHLGDGASDAEQLKKQYPNVTFYQAKGNMDAFSSNKNTVMLPQCSTFEADGFKFFICHGHTLGVKSGLEPLIATACHNGADIAMYGHTHDPYCRYIPPEELPVKREKCLYIFNPGSISLPNYGHKASYGIIETKPPYILLSHGTTD